MEKTCQKCGLVKELELFAKGKGYKDGRKGTCKGCHSKRMTEYYKLHPEKYAEKVRMNTHYKPNWYRHKLTESAYEELLTLHEGKCHSCQDSLATNIDHDHACCPGSFSCGNCVRGVLCHHCNTALGLLKDNAQKIQKMLEYIS